MEIFLVQKFWKLAYCMIFEKLIQLPLNSDEVYSQQYIYVSQLDFVLPETQITFI